MKLVILTPEEKFYDDEADSVTLPGTLGSFTILGHHAPIISSLANGTIKFVKNNVLTEVEVHGGIVEMSNNTVTVCLESAIEIE